MEYPSGPKLGEEHRTIAATLNNIAVVYDTQGRYEKALEFYGRALAMRLKRLREDHPDVAATLNYMAIVYETQGRAVQVERC